MATVSYKAQPKSYSNFKLDPVKSSTGANAGAPYNPNMQQFANNAALNSNDISNILGIANSSYNNPMGVLMSAIGYNHGKEYDNRGTMKADQESQGLLQDFIREKAMQSMAQQPKITDSAKQGADKVSGGNIVVQPPPPPTAKQLVNQQSDYYAKLQADPNARGNEIKQQQDLADIEQAMKNVDITQYSNEEIWDYIANRLDKEKGRKPNQIANIQQGVLARIDAMKRVQTDKKITDLVNQANENLNNPEKLTAIASQLSRMGSPDAALYAQRANGLFNELTQRRLSRQALMDKIAYAQWAQANGLKGYGTVGAGGGTTGANPAGGGYDPNVTYKPIYADRFNHPLTKEQVERAKDIIKQTETAGMVGPDGKPLEGFEPKSLADFSADDQALVKRYQDDLYGRNGTKYDLINEPDRAQREAWAYGKRLNGERPITEVINTLAKEYGHAPWFKDFIQGFVENKYTQGAHDFGF